MRQVTVTKNTITVKELSRRDGAMAHYAEQELPAARAHSQALQRWLFGSNGPAEVGRLVFLAGLLFRSDGPAASLPAAYCAARLHR